MPVLVVLFLLSGFSALVYQVVWLRLLALVFGVTIFAASAVLTSFMAGLAIGAWLGGRLADRVRQPLLAFAFVEFGIAASALLVPFALDLAAGLYVAIHTRMPDAVAPLTAARTVVSATILLVPTTLMGASLPLLSRHVARLGGAAAARIGYLYAANTAGGIAGTVLAGFVMIGALGLSRSAHLAVLVNAIVGLAALGLAVGRPVRLPAVEAAIGRAALALPPLTRDQRAVLAVMLLAGFTGLALEVVWFRLLVLFLPATSYAFSTMLATVLLGIALGSAVAAWRLPRTRHPLPTLAWIQIATGLLVLLSMTALAVTYRLGWKTSGMVQASLMAMLPATTLMGATFPFALAVWLRQGTADVGTRVGTLYAVNVCGAVLGALAGGFLLLPQLGSRPSLVLLAGAYVAAGCYLAQVAGGRRLLLRMAAAALILFVAATVALPDVYSAVLARRYGPAERVVFREEGVQTTATVHHQPAGHLVLYLDGLHQANDTEAMVRVHAEIGHLPIILHQDPREALVIGLGGGVTPGAVAQHRGVAVDVVELARSVVSAAPLFAHVNADLLNRPNVRLRVDDGRNYLLLTDRDYDVLTADIIQPVHAGAGNLYSVEYFRLARQVLREGGVMLQWIGHREEAHYKLIMRTFLEVFPHATLWSGGTLMVGTPEPLRISEASFRRRLADPEARFALARIGLDTFDALLARYTAGPEEMRQFVGPGPILTDDRPLLEYHRSLLPGPMVDVSALRGDVRRHLE